MGRVGGLGVEERVGEVLEEGERGQQAEVGEVVEEEGGEDGAAVGGRGRGRGGAGGVEGALPFVEGAEEAVAVAGLGG